MKNVGQDRSWLILATAVFIAGIPRLGGGILSKTGGRKRRVYTRKLETKLHLTEQMPSGDWSICILIARRKTGRRHRAGVDRVDNILRERERERERKKEENIFGAGNLPRIILRFEIATPSYEGTRIRRGFSRFRAAESNIWLSSLSAGKLIRCGLHEVSHVPRQLTRSFTFSHFFPHYSTSIANLSFSSLFSSWLVSWRNFRRNQSSLWERLDQSLEKKRVSVNFRNRAESYLTSRITFQLWSFP